jgi:Asp-tRNA(Asn)/Glu-tRNA(Gln) amidotransferase C subunit
MSISREEILQIATLARLRVTDAESEALSQDLNQILEYFDMLASLQVPEGGRLGLGPPRAPEREPGQIPPDPMAQPPADSAPDFREEFFVVPSPPSLGEADDPGGSP